MKYLTTFAEKVGKERFDAESAKVIKGSDIAPRSAAKGITVLEGHDRSHR
ncbi:hypothetical protein [Streptomyces sp. S.PNR 29]|nr:hypothetical protein [Streptomyces sp. S.PNR 29]MDN0201213.1 hypothetical protein [Streptomyces sp. S.PNR 29]